MGLFEFKIRQFSKIMKWAEMQDVSQLRQFLFDNKCCNRLFVASGGSFSAAAYAELLATDQGFMSHALTPLLYMGSGFSRIATKVLLISASGCNNDIVRAYNNEYRTTKQKVGAVVLTPKGKLQSLLQEILSLIPGHVPSLRISTTHNTPIASIDLLIKEHYLCSAIGQRWGLDLSRPFVPEYGRILHAK